MSCLLRNTPYNALSDESRLRLSDSLIKQTATEHEPAHCTFGNRPCIFR